MLKKGNLPASYTGGKKPSKKTPVATAIRQSLVESKPKKAAKSGKKKT